MKQIIKSKNKIFLLVFFSTFSLSTLANDWKGSWNTTFGKMTVTTTDFIPTLQMHSKPNRSGTYELPGDTFEIILEMAPSDKASGKIEAFRFKVTK